MSSKNTTRSYTDILADAIGSLSGFGAIAAGGAAIAVATTSASAAAVVTTATASTVYNQFQNDENKVNAFNKSREIGGFIANRGYAMFAYAHPMLFSAGHAVSSTTVKLAAYGAYGLVCGLDKAYSSFKPAMA